MARRLGLDLQVIESEWSETAPFEGIGEAPKPDPAHHTKAAMIVHSETATGVTSDTRVHL